MKKQIKCWLEAGIMEGDKLFPSTEGTPQGGIISPLLANITLHVLENKLKIFVASKSKAPTMRNLLKSQLSVIRYADDFLIFHSDQEILNKCIEIIKEFLSKYGLQINSEKTKIIFPFSENNSQNFKLSFLGFDIHQYFRGKYKRGGKRRILFVTHCKPSSEKIIQHKVKIREILKPRTNVINMIKELNLRIKGWTNYYRIGVVSKTFSSLDHWLFWRLFLWACKTHTTRGNKWIAARYFLNNPENIWKFGSKLQDKVYYQTFHRRTNVRRHIKVQNTRSPYDKDWVYWGYRLSNFQDGVIPNRVLKLLRIQKCKSPICHLNFLCNDNVHVDHIIPRSQGGSDVYQNLQLLHQHCHQNKTREDIKYLKY